MDRAIAFYEKVFDCKLDKNDMGDLVMAWFPSDQEMKGAGGSLIDQMEFYAPSGHAGALIYFSSENCEIELGRVVEAGGSVQIQKKMIAPDIGKWECFWFRKETESQLTRLPEISLPLKSKVSFWLHEHRSQAIAQYLPSWKARQ